MPWQPLNPQRAGKTVWAYVHAAVVVGPVPPPVVALPVPVEA